MTQKIIAVDVDGVVADLDRAWLGRYNADYGDNLTSESLKCWDMTQAVKTECGRKIYDYLNDPTLYDDVPVIEGALEGVQALRGMGHRVVFATATNINQMTHKLKWLERNGFVTLTHGTVCRDYVPVQDKSLVRASLLLDDGVHNLETFEGIKLLFSRPHNLNETVKGVLRLDGWAEVVAWIGELG